jgi:hypothetical protein
MSGLRESLPAGHEPGILLRSLPDVCQAEIRAGTQAAGASGKGELVRNLAEKRQRFQGFQGPVHRAAKEEYAYLAKQGEAADKRRFLRLIFYLYFCYAGIVGRDADPKGKDGNRAGDYAD